MTRVINLRLAGPKQPTEPHQQVQSAFYEKVPAGGVDSGAVRGECVLVGGLKGCYWWKTV
jgi:hypothetical protein